MTAFDDRLSALREQFRSRCRAQGQELRAALDADDRDAIVRSAHSLAGTGGIFGFHDISRAAELLEREADAAKGNREAVLKLGTALLNELDDIARSGS